MAKTEERGELIGYMENGGFVGIEDHEMVAEPLKVSVNKPLTGLATEHSQRIHGERIEIWKRKIGAHVNDNGEMSAVTKKWKGIQKPLKSQEGDISSPSTRFSSPEASQYNQPKGELTPLQVLKNAFDNLDHRVGQMDSWLKVALVFGGIGLVGTVLAMASVLV